VCALILSTFAGAAEATQYQSQRKAKAGRGCATRLRQVGISGHHMKLSFGAGLVRERPSTLARRLPNAASSTGLQGTVPSTGTSGAGPGVAPDPDAVCGLAGSIDGEIHGLTPVAGPKFGPV